MRQSLGQKLRHLRDSYQYTQAELCRYLHIERSAYANYETDKRVPAYPLIVKLADFYHVSVDYLVREDYTDCSPLYTQEAKRLLLMLSQLKPETRIEVQEYISYRLKRQKLKSS